MATFETYHPIAPLLNSILDLIPDPFKICDRTKNFHTSYTAVNKMSPHNVKTYTGTTGEWRVYSQNYPIIYLQATFGISENDSGFKTPYCLVPVEKKYSLSPNEYYKININATGWSNKQTGLLNCEWSLVKTQ